MQYRSYAVVSILLLIMLCFSGCFAAQNDTLTAPQAYEAAVSALDGKDFTVTISTMQQTQAKEQVVRESSISKVSYRNYGKQNMRVSTEKSILIGENDVTVREFYGDESILLQVNNGCFSSAATPEQALSRYFPLGIFNTDSYQNVQTQDFDSRRMIGFTQPTKAEAWAIPQQAQITDATGSAVLHEDGTLAESTYSITYTHGAATVTYTATATFDFSSAVTVKAPEDTELYIPVKSVDAPVLLETACAKLLQAPQVSAQFVYDIICEAGGLQRTKNTEVMFSESNVGLSAQVDTLVTLTNHSLQGAISSVSQTETFTGGTYSISSDSGTSTPSVVVTEDEMRGYCKNHLVSSVLLPQYIEQTELTETEQSYCLSFSGNQSLAQLLFTDAYQTLYTDTVVSDSLIQAYSTQSVSGHIEINKFTGLPICSGLSYHGANTIDETTHGFNVTIEQTYNYAIQ